MRIAALKLKNLFLTSIMVLCTILPAVSVEELPSIENSGLKEEIYIDNDTYKMYKKVSKDDRIINAIETMKGTLGDYSRRAILGDNLSGKPIAVEFRDLSQINEAYRDFDALGWKYKDKLYIFINIKHQDAPKEALASVLSHEALHQDELNSINEETYCWTLEAAVWNNFTEQNPSLEEISHPLVMRENTIKRLFIKGNYTDKYIRKSVMSNAGYQTLPSRSPGFEDENL